jgi:2'-5' RNA ligase
MARCFIAVTVPEDVKDSLEDFKKRVVSLGADCKLVERENTHVTISFLGDVEEGSLEEIFKKMDAITSRHGPFQADVGRLKFIPSLKYARVLAFDVSDKNGNVKRLSAEVMDSIGGDVKPPHLTVGRLRKYGDVGSLAKLDGAVLEKSFVVSSLCLFQSKLSNKGPKYILLHESKMKSS